MKRRHKRNNRLFHHLAADLSRVRKTLTATVCCPLCLEEFSLDASDALSVEHIVPSKLGGYSTTLTCTRCNNQQGTKLDSHLVQAMRALDSAEGKEPIPTTVRSPHGNIALSMFLPERSEPDEGIRLLVVGKASSQPGMTYLQENLGDGFELELRLNFRYIPERYWRAAIRSAYLGAFVAQGYEYVFSDGAARVRAVLNGDMPAPSNVIMEAFPEQQPPHDLLVMPCSFNDAGDCVAVLLRFRTKSTRYLVVLLPGKYGSDWDLLGTLQQHAPRLRIETTPEQWDSKLIINLGFDPENKFRTAQRAAQQIIANRLPTRPE